MAWRCPHTKQLITAPPEMGGQARALGRFERATAGGAVGKHRANSTSATTLADFVRDVTQLKKPGLSTGTKWTATFI